MAAKGYAWHAIVDRLGKLDLTPREPPAKAPTTAKFVSAATSEARKAGYRPLECREAGFSYQEGRQAGYPHGESWWAKEGGNFWNIDFVTPQGVEPPAFRARRVPPALTAVGRGAPPAPAHCPGDSAALVSSPVAPCRHSRR